MPRQVSVGLNIIAKGEGREEGSKIIIPNRAGI